MPEEGDLLVTFGLEVFYFVENGIHVAAAFASAGIRHDAIRTEVVAAAHDRNKAADCLANARGNNLAVGFGRTQFDI